jgi:branched-chain amino acid transport system ATP-binding protein
MTVLLSTNHATMRFGGLVAVNDLNIQLKKNTIVALIGPNGAGKTTAFNMITGVYTPTLGNIVYKGSEINRLRSDQITKMGIARTFQNIHLFKGLSVFDNVIVGGHCHKKYGLFASTFHLPGSVREEREMKKNVHILLERLGLGDYHDELATSLPYGLQRRLEIARALMTRPEILLLDEPAAGMNPKESRDLTGFIKEIRTEFNLTIFLIEHHMQLVMDVSEEIYVLEYGNTIAHGTPEEIRDNPVVIKAYLGEDDIE